MNEKLKEFLDAKKEAEQKKHEEEKQKTLIELGLFEKVYSPDNKQSEEFPFYEWDDGTPTSRYYKEVPIEITDEEYQEVKKYLKKEDETKNNPIATGLTFIAWAVIICGFVAGCVLGNIEVAGYYGGYTKFSFAVAFTYWCVALISGTMFLGFAEIIKLLEAVKRK